MMPPCGEDCRNCPHADCIVDEIAPVTELAKTDKRRGRRPQPPAMSALEAMQLLWAARDATKKK